MTHKSPLPEDVEKGFICGRKTKNKVFLSSLIALVLSLISFYFEKTNPLREILSWFLEIPLVLSGIYLGPVFWHIWQRKEAVFETVDDIENGKIDVKKKICAAATEVAKDVMDKANNAFDDVLNTFNAKQVEEKALTKDVKEKLPQDDPQDLMNKYLHK